MLAQPTDGRPEISSCDVSSPLIRRADEFVPFHGGKVILSRLSLAHSSARASAYPRWPRRCRPAPRLRHARNPRSERQSLRCMGSAAEHRS